MPICMCLCKLSKKGCFCLCYLFILDRIFVPPLFLCLKPIRTPLSLQTVPLLCPLLSLTASSFIVIYLALGSTNRTFMVDYFVWLHAVIQDSVGKVTARSGSIFLPHYMSLIGQLSLMIFIYQKGTCLCVPEYFRNLCSLDFCVFVPLARGR